jgi:hypothetical protein
MRRAEADDTPSTSQPVRPGALARTGSWQRAVPWLLAGLLVLIGATQLDQYSVTWDEALGDLFFGDRYFSYFTSLDRDYLDFSAEPHPAGRTPDLSASPFRNRPWEYYPLVNVLGAACTALLHRGLGVLDPFDAFHAVNLLLGALFLIGFYRFVERRRDSACATLAVLLLFTAPRIVVHLLANTKDFPELVLFGAALLVFVGALERGSIRALLLAGMLTGAALATKANALFLAPIFLLAVLATGAWSRFGGWRKLTAGGVAAALLALAIPLLSWPYLWSAPIEHATLHLQYIAGQVNQVRAESLLSPLAAIAFTTPLPWLLLALWGVVPTVRAARRREPLAVVVLAWIAVTIGRMYLPGAVNFDGVRHFLELFPALALLALEGAQSLAAVLDQRIGNQVRGGRRTLWAAIACLAVIAQIAPTVRLHPHQIAYWNVLTGGTSGAFERGLPQAGDYWALSYRQGMRWLNENAEPGARLGVPIVEHAVRLTAPVRLRSDIQLLDLSSPTSPRIPPEFVGYLLQMAAADPDLPIYVMFVRRDDWSNPVMEFCRTQLEPVYEIEVDGAAILQIFRLPAVELGS